MLAIKYFQELERLGILKRFQNDLYLLTGLAFDFVDLQAHSSLYLRAIDKYIPFCRQISNAPRGRHACENCNRQAIQNCLELKRDVVSTCHLGLTDICVPIILADSPVGVLSTGQFLLRAPTEKGFGKIKPQLIKIGLNINKIHGDYLRVPVLEKARLRAIVNIIHIVADSIVAAARELPLLQAAAHEDKVIQAREYIDSNYTENISAKDIAAKVNISSSRLSHLFKESLDTTLTSYLHDVRLHWAKYYLENTTLRVSEIAFRVGFENLGHFNRLFHAKVGFSPLKFRQQKSAKK